MDDDHQEEEVEAHTGATAIKYGAWVIMLLAVLYFLANYIVPLF